MTERRCSRSVALLPLFAALIWPFAGLVWPFAGLVGGLSQARALPIPADHGCIGHWVGRGRNTGYDTSWTIDLTLTTQSPNGDDCGSVEYTNPSCGGRLTECRLESDGIHVRERYSHSDGNCATEGEVILRCEGDSLHFAWIGWERVDSTLHRQASDAHSPTNDSTASESTASESTASESTASESPPNSGSRSVADSPGANSQSQSNSASSSSHDSPDPTGSFADFGCRVSFYRAHRDLAANRDLIAHPSAIFWLVAIALAGVWRARSGLRHTRKNATE